MKIIIRPATFKNSVSPMDKNPFELLRDFIAAYTNMHNYGHEMAGVYEAIKEDKYYRVLIGGFVLRVDPDPNNPGKGHIEVESSGVGEYIGMGDNTISYTYEREDDGIRKNTVVFASRLPWKVGFTPDIWGVMVDVTRGNNEPEPDDGLDTVITQVFDASPEWARATMPTWLKRMAPTCGRENGWRGWGSHLFSRVRRAYADWAEAR